MLGLRSRKPAVPNTLKGYSTRNIHKLGSILSAIGQKKGSVLKYSTPKSVCDVSEKYVRENVKTDFIERLSHTSYFIRNQFARSTMETSCALDSRKTNPKNARNKVGTALGAF